MNLDHVLARRFEPIRQSYDWRDSALYALGLGMGVPADRYRPSPRAMPERVPQVQYDPTDIVRIASSTRSYISFKGWMRKVPQAFCGERLAIRPLDRDGSYGIFFASWQVASMIPSASRCSKQAAPSGSGPGPSSAR